jgi:hypothetical protein
MPFSIFLIPHINSFIKFLLVKLYINMISVYIYLVILSFVCSFFSELRFSLLQNVGVDIAKETEPSNIDVMTKTLDSFSKRTCLFPLLNESKKSSFDDETKILAELDTFLCEESCVENLLFAKKAYLSMFISTWLKYLSVPASPLPPDGPFLTHASKYIQTQISPSRIENKEFIFYEFIA